jgi:acetyltransferase (isoleucine patch superfamily)
MLLNRLIKKFLYRLRSDVTTEDLIKRGMVLGNNFNRMHGVILDDSHCWLISIGDNVTMAPRVHILAHDASTCHHLGYARIGRVDIGNNVFIGADTVVLPGVSIGDNSVIGANSTVTKSIPANVVAAGNPAKIICTIEEYTERNRIRLKKGHVYGEDFTMRGRITPQKKIQQRKDLKDNCGFVI